MWAVTGIRTAPRPVGANCVQAQPAASYDGGGFLWEVGTSYNERRFLWEAARFAWAVTCMRRPPRPVGANCTRVQPARRVKPAFMPRPASTAGAGVSMGSDALRLGCNLHEGNPARQGGRGCRLSLPGQPAFMRAYRIRGARGFLLGSDALCMGCISHMDSPAR